jgi:hypothetical protein
MVRRTPYGYPRVISKWRQATVLSHPTVSRLLRRFVTVPLFDQMEEFLWRQTLDETGFEDLDYQSQTLGIYLKSARADRPLVEFQWPAIAWD